MGCLKAVERHWYVTCVCIETLTESQITVALVTKTRTFLEDESWSMGPWLGQDNEVAQNQLIDILARIPGILQDQQELRKSSKKALHESLASNISGQLSATYAWRSRWMAVNHHTHDAVSGGVEYPLLGLTPSRPFSKVLVCSGWRQATEICLHNVVVLVLLSVLWTLETVKERTHQSWTFDYLLPDQISTLEKAAINISRTMEDQLATASQSCGHWLREKQSLARTGPDGDGTAVQMNVVVGGLWLKLWPAFPLF